MSEISIKDFAALVNLTPARIYHQLAAGVLQEKRKGILDKDQAFLGLIGFYQAATKSKAIDAGNGSFLDGKAARSRLATAQADREELELAKARGELIAVADHEKTLSEMVMATRARILGVPSKASAELVGLTSRNMALAIVEKHLHLALQDLSTTTPAPLPREDQPQEEEEPTPEVPKAKAKPTVKAPKATRKGPKSKAKPTPKPAKAKKGAARRV